jgi:hypothetical protein
MPVALFVESLTTEDLLAKMRDEAYMDGALTRLWMVAGGTFPDGAPPRRRPTAGRMRRPRPLE